MSAEVPLHIDCQSVKAMQDRGEDFLLLDCRQSDEWEIVRLPGGKLIPMHEIVARVGEIEPYRARSIVVHCHHGGRSLQVVNWLRNQGFAKAQNMHGGIDRWAIEIDPSLPRY